LPQPGDGLLGISPVLHGQKGFQVPKPGRHLAFGQMVSPEVDGLVIAEAGGELFRQHLPHQPLLADLLRNGLLQNGPRDLEEFFALFQEP